jgi:hypothetical protein
MAADLVLFVCGTRNVVEAALPVPPAYAPVAES